MAITQAVKNVLSWYESDSTKTKQSLARMLMQGRLGGSGKMVILPVDQGFEHGPARSFAVNPASYDPHYHFQLAIDAGLNAYAAPLGMIEAGAETFKGRIPTILKINSNNSLVPKDTPPDQAVTGSVKDAVRLGCSAVGFTIYPGSAACHGMMEEIRAIGEEAKANGLAVVIWSYPRGAGLSKEGELAIDVTAYAAHLAALLGAHIVKVKPPTSHIEQAEAKKVYEKEHIPRRHAGRARRACEAGGIRRPAAGHFLRRRRQIGRRGDGGGAADRQGRRRRLHHGPQRLPAPAPRSARPAFGHYRGV